jgi:hypothetical protein
MKQQPETYYAFILIDAYTEKKIFEEGTYISELHAHIEREKFQPLAELYEEEDNQINTEIESYQA